jgi:hypothetical protein
VAVFIDSDDPVQQPMDPDIQSVQVGIILRKSKAQSIRFTRSQMAVGIYLAFDWIMPGKFEAFANRKAFC